MVVQVKMVVQGKVEVEVLCQKGDPHSIQVVVYRKEVHTLPLQMVVQVKMVVQGKVQAGKTVS